MVLDNRSFFGGEKDIEDCGAGFRGGGVGVSGGVRVLGAFDKARILEFLPRENETIHFWCDRSFNPIAFLQLFLRHFGNGHEVLISTFSMSVRTVKMINQMIQAGMIRDFNLIVSDTVRHLSSKDDTFIELKVVMAQESRFKCKLAPNHSKVLLFRGESCNFSLVGSGNFSKNQNYERYVISNSTDVYNFDREMILEMFKG